MIGLINAYLKKHFISREEFSDIKKDIDRLNAKINDLEIINADLHVFSKKQSELINAVASVQSDIIGVFVSAEHATGHFQPSVDPADKIKSIIVPLPGGDDDDFLN